MGRVLGIDHGDARIGLAVSDDLGMLAHPLGTVRVGEGDPLEEIQGRVKEHRIETVVLGMPFSMDGSSGPAVAKVRRFREELEEVLGPGVSIVEVDERFSTVAAQAKLHRAGKNTRQSRGVIDQMAAVEILQGYLDRQALETGAALDEWDEDGDE